MRFHLLSFSYPLVHHAYHELDDNLYKLIMKESSICSKSNSLSTSDAVRQLTSIEEQRQTFSNESGNAQLSQSHEFLRVVTC